MGPSPTGGTPIEGDGVEGGIVDPQLATENLSMQASAIGHQINVEASVPLPQLPPRMRDWEDDRNDGRRAFTPIHLLRAFAMDRSAQAGLSAEQTKMMTEFAEVKHSTYLAGLESSSKNCLRRSSAPVKCL